MSQPDLLFDDLLFTILSSNLSTVGPSIILPVKGSEAFDQGPWGDVA